jgi:hypothetical protein
VGRHPNTSLHLTARTGGAFPKAVGAAGELGVIDIYSSTKLLNYKAIKTCDFQFILCSGIRYSPQPLASSKAL